MSRPRLIPVLLALLLGAFAALPPPAALAQAEEDEETGLNGVSSAKLALIMRYIEASNTLGTYDQSVRGVVKQYEQIFPQVEPKFWQEFTSYHTDVTDLYKRLIPVYAKHFTESDLKDILVFLESPAGRKYTAVLPQVSLDVMKAAREFEIDLNKRIIQKLRDSGY
jgi:uncharacterized protein